MSSRKRRREIREKKAREFPPLPGGMSHFIISPGDGEPFVRLVTDLSGLLGAIRGGSIDTLGEAETRLAAIVERYEIDTGETWITPAEGDEGG